MALLENFNNKAMKVEIYFALKFAATLGKMVLNSITDPKYGYFAVLLNIAPTL